MSAGAGGHASRADATQLDESQVITGLLLEILFYERERECVCVCV
jgi:hypothetical protein